MSGFFLFMLNHAVYQFSDSVFFLESVDKIDIRYRRERKTVIKKKPRTRFARRGSRLTGPPEGMPERLCRPGTRGLPTRWGPAARFFAKNVSPARFLNAQTLSGFESLLDKKHSTHKSECCVFGPPEGIRTPDLQNRNLTLYPAALRAEIFYCFI